MSSSSAYRYPLVCLGLDPGLDGAVALLNTEDGDLKVWDMPLVVEGKKRRLNYAAYLDIIEGIWANTRVLHRVMVESVSAMPGQGVSSMFAFGQVYGAQVMGLHAFSYTPTFVRPNVWKMAMGCGANKDASLIRCLDEFGNQHSSLWWGKNMGVLDGRCEAALLALYGSRR